MRIKCLLIVLSIAVTCTSAVAQGLTKAESTLVRTEFVLEDLEVNKRHTLFVYCLPPVDDPNAKTTISLSRADNPDWIRVPSKQDSDGQWLRNDYRPLHDHWSKVRITCTIESNLLTEDYLRQKARFFTLLDDEPMSWGDVHETSGNFFEDTPVTDRGTEMGKFVYELPWPANVKIEIFEKNREGYRRTRPPIVINDHPQDPGAVQRTAWDSGHRFKEMPNGEYIGQLTATQTDGDKRYRKIKVSTIRIRFDRK